MSTGKSGLQLIVEKIQKLPTVADVGIRVLELASDPDVSMNELSHAIHQDPSLAARVLKIANSPFYGTTNQVDSLQLALVILGLNEVRNIALGLSVFAALRKMNSHVTYDRRQFWYHSTACGVVARILGQKAGFKSEGVDFIAGLLHDMGKIIIDEYFGKEFENIYEKALKRECGMLEAEREFLGESHEAIGAWLVDKWGLPETLREAILHHHDLFSGEHVCIKKDPRLMALSYISEAFCGHRAIGWDGDFDSCNVKEPEAWKLLLSSQTPPSSEDIDQILQETAQAFNESRDCILFI